LRGRESKLWIFLRVFKLQRRDALLQELRTLAACYCEDAVVREQLAKGLSNTLGYVQEERIYSFGTRCCRSCAPCLKLIPATQELLKSTKWQKRR
jgi:hypothetical protein